MDYIDSVLAQIEEILGKKVDRKLVLETLFLMRSVFEARAKMYGEPAEFLHDMFAAMDALYPNDSVKKRDSLVTFFVVMISLKLSRFANDPYGEHGEDSMLDMVNYGILLLIELRKMKESRKKQNPDQESSEHDSPN